MPEPLSIQLTPESLREVIDAQVRAAVLAAMQAKGPQLLHSLVDKVLLSNVRHDYRDIPFLDYAIQEFLKVEIQTALKQYITDNQELLRDQIERAFRDKRSGFGPMIAQALVKNAENAFRFEINIKPRD